MWAHLAQWVHHEKFGFTNPTGSPQSEQIHKIEANEKLKRFEKFLEEKRALITEKIKQVELYINNLTQKLKQMLLRMYKIPFRKK